MEVIDPADTATYPITACCLWAQSPIFELESQIRQSHVILELLSRFEWLFEDASCRQVLQFANGSTHVSLCVAITLTGCLRAVLLAEKRMWLSRGSMVSWLVNQGQGNSRLYFCKKVEGLKWGRAKLATNSTRLLTHPRSPPAPDVGPIPQRQQQSPFASVICGGNVRPTLARWRFAPALHKHALSDMARSAGAGRETGTRSLPLLLVCHSRAALPIDDAPSDAALARSVTSCLASGRCTSLHTA